MQQQLFKVRDRRNKGWFYLDNEYLNGIGKYLKPTGIAVYVSLCRHADSEQKCFPKQETIAEEIGASDRNVRRYLKKLEELNIIKLVKGRKSGGQWLNNTYYLLDKTEWSYPEDTVSYGKPEDKRNTTIGQKRQSQRTLCPIKDTNTNNTNKNNTNREVKPLTPSEEAKEFFNREEKEGEIIQGLAEKGMPEDLAKREIRKFISYWTEPNKSGTRQRWEMEKTFEVGRRLNTWFSRIKDYNNTPKFIKIK